MDYIKRLNNGVEIVNTLIADGKIDDAEKYYLYWQGYLDALSRQELISTETWYKFLDSVPEELVDKYVKITL